MFISINKYCTSNILDLYTDKTVKLKFVLIFTNIMNENNIS